jgi:hypothetical protein
MKLQTYIWTKCERPAKWQAKIVRSGRCMIIFGVPVAGLAILVVSTLRHGLEPGLANAVGEKALPYVLFFTPVALGAVGTVLYEYFPKRLVVPVGVAGWIIGLGLLYWYFWFGPAWKS